MSAFTVTPEQMLRLQGAFDNLVAAGIELAGTGADTDEIEQWANVIGDVIGEITQRHNPNRGCDVDGWPFARR